MTTLAVSYLQDEYFGAMLLLTLQPSMLSTWGLLSARQQLQFGQLVEEYEETLCGVDQEFI